jgi:hypothetical protein
MYLSFAEALDANNQSKESAELDIKSLIKYLILFTSKEFTTT